jgi:flagellar biosynthesis protein FlhB
MSLFVNVSEEEAFRLMMDYFTSKHMKILTSNFPSYIRAEFGSWTSMSLNNAKGQVEAEITEGNGGSYSNLNFSFFKEYLSALIIAIFGTLLLCVVMWWRATRDMSRINRTDMGNFLFKVNLITFGLSAIMFAVVIGLVGYSTSLTRRRFIEEFNMFMQSLPSKKD